MAGKQSPHPHPCIPRNFAMDVFRACSATGWIGTPMFYVWYMIYDNVYIYTPSGYVKIAIENGPVEIVDLPMNSIGIFQFAM